MKRNLNLQRLFLSLLGLWIGSARTVFGQTSSGVISGRVVDPSGLPMACADVTLVNELTGETPFNPAASPLSRRCRASRNCVKKDWC